MITPNNCNAAIVNQPLLIYDIFFALFLLPFLVAGLYYGYNEDPYCGNMEFSGISFGLRTWLRVDSWMMLGVLIGALFNVIRFCCSVTSYCSYVIWIITRSVFLAWRLAWLIVGSVLFWKHLHPSDRCSW
jgi:uncharacterized membrane protein